MNTLHLKYAVEVAKTGSISQAAENLFMAQPNLSKAIKELEDHLGIPIFQRTSKGVIPTEQGSEFLLYAKRILLQVEHMEALYVPKKEREKIQQLKLSIPRGSYLSAACSKVVSELNMDKGMKLRIQETNSVQTIQNLVECGYHLGIIRYEKEEESYFLDYLQEHELEEELIWEYELVVIMSKNHPFAQKEKLSLLELRKDYCELLHGDTVIPYKKVKAKRQKQQEKKIYVYERGSQMELLTNVSTTFMLASPLPQEFLERYQLVQRKCSDERVCCVDRFIMSKHHKYSTIEKLFMSKVWEVLSHIKME